MNRYRATSFATRQDLARFAAYVTAGHSVSSALSVGDNGVGAFGDATWNPHNKPMCALPHGIAVHNRAVTVTLKVGHGSPFTCYCTDISPKGIIDLNPAALVAAGLDPDHDLSDPNATWQWADAVKQARKKKR